MDGILPTGLLCCLTSGQFICCDEDRNIQTIPKKTYVGFASLAVASYFVCVSIQNIKSCLVLDLH